MQRVPRQRHQAHQALLCPWSPNKPETLKQSLNIFAACFYHQYVVLAPIHQAERHVSAA